MRRTLLITSQLAEFGIPMVLVLNMIDEAEERGIEIDSPALSDFFCIPVVETVAIYSRGRRQLLNAIQNPKTPRNPLQGNPGEKNIQSLHGLSAPALLSIEWLAEGDRELVCAFASARGEQAITQLREWQEKYRTSSHAIPPRK